jgi:hypothetical protein
MKQERQLPKIVVKEGDHTRRLRAIENEFSAECLIHFQMRGRQASAFMLQTGQKGAESLRFIFGWEVKGIHTTLNTDQEDAIFDALEAGLKDIPEEESMTVHMGSFASDEQRQNELSQVVAQTDSTELKYLILAEKKRVGELTWVKDARGSLVAKGLRKPKFLRIYCTYTIGAITATGSDVWEKMLLRIQNAYYQVVGSAPEIAQQRYEIALEKAFIDGFLNWEQNLATKMGLEITPLGAEELWQNLWRQFNTTEPPPIPQLVIMTEQGIREQVNSDVHFTTRLFETATPVDDRRWINVNGKYVAPMVFSDKPGGWVSKFSQLSYIWKVMSREPVFDTEVFCQVTKANQGIIRDNMRRVMKQSLLEQEISSTKHRSIDVAASLRQDKAIRAQEQLYEGAVALQTATVFLVHRATLPKLDEACRYIQNCFHRPAWVEREKEYAWKIWLQTLPLTWEPLLAKPFNRRLLYLTGEAPGLMPLVCPHAIDQRGFELISEEGGVPLFIDPFSQHRNIALFGTTRSGKSVAVSGLLTHALARGIPTIIMDFPPSDAASTFKDWTTFLQGAYFDIGKECNNLFEMPDLSAFDAKEQRERLSDYIDFLESALMTMVFGGGEATTSDDRLFRQSLRSILGPAIRKFFDHTVIRSRYEAARQGGLGSQAWADTPTLVDFLAFFKLEGLADLSSEAQADATTIRAMNHIERQLTFWIHSRVGSAISRPSTFRTDNQLLVFALRGLSDAEDAAVLALSAYSAALRRTLSHRESIFFIDEFSVLMEWSQIAALIARLCANGAKAGIRVCLAAQDPNTLLNSVSGPKIIQNVSLRLIGRIQPVAIKSFQSFFGYSPEVIGVNASERFYPQVSEMYSQWLVDDGNRITYARFYPSPELLAVVANNPHETDCRNAFMVAYPDNSFKAISAFGRELVNALKNGRPLQKPPPTHETQPVLMPLNHAKVS